MHFKSKHLGSLMKPNPQSHSARQFIPNFSALIHTKMTVEANISVGVSHMFHVNILARNYIIFGGKIIIGRVRYASLCIAHRAPTWEISLQPPRSLHCYHTSGQCITINTPMCCQTPVTGDTVHCHTLMYTGADNYLLIFTWPGLTGVTTCFKLSR